MEENQNGWNGQEPAHTYGEDSRLYEKGQQENENGQNPYTQPGNGQNPYIQPGNGQNPYTQPGNGQNPYTQPGNGVWQGCGGPQMQHGLVPDIFCNILISIFIARVLMSFVMLQQTFSAIDSYDSIMNGSYLVKLVGGPYQILAMFSNLLFVASIVFVILDIIKIYKANYKITGLILFAIFFNPGYYIWRAYILGRKKTVPVIYTVVYGGLKIAYFIYTFYTTFSMAFEMTQTMF